MVHIAGATGDGDVVNNSDVNGRAALASDFGRLAITLVTSKI